MPAGVLGSALLLGLYARGDAAWPLGFVALVPWLLVQDRLASWRSTLLASLAMAVAFVAAVFGWFAPAVAAYTGWPPAFAFVALLLLAPLLQPQVVAHALVRRMAGRARIASRAALSIAAWLATEWAVPRLFGDTFGHGLHASTVLRQAADIAGPTGLTLALLVVNEALASAIARRRDGARAWTMPLALAAVVPLVLAGYGTWRLAAVEREPGGAPLRIGLVQASITDYERLRREMGGYAVVRHVLDTHYAMSERARSEHRVDAVVWPETVYPTTFMAPRSADGAALDAEVVAFVRRLGVPLVFGTYDRDDAGEYNAAAFVDPQRGALGHYRKTRLFPLTEYVPAAVDGAPLRRALPWAGTWRPGDGARVFPLTADGREVPVVPLICRDDVEPALALDGARLGAQLIVGLSNDAWFTAAPQGARLHLIVAAFRSIETRLPQVRATTNGLSAVIDPTGAIVARTAMGERTVLVATVTPRDAARTPVMVWGPWLGPVAALALALVAVVALATRWRRQGGAAGTVDVIPATDGPWRIALLTPAVRALVAALRVLARGAVLGLGALVLLGDEPLGRLEQIRLFAALVLAPEVLAALLLLWTARGTARIEGDSLVLDTPRRRIEIPLRSIAAARPWRLPLPSPGLDLDLAAGGRWMHGVALHDPVAFASWLAATGAPIAPPARSERRAGWHHALALPSRRWDHPVAKFVLFPLVPALPAFRLHQHIAYGGTFGEAYTFGVEAWLLALGLWWASWAVALVLLAGGLRLLVEAATLAAVALRPDGASTVRAMLLAVTRLAYYVGIPAWLGLRLLAG